MTEIMRILDLTLNIHEKMPNYPANPRVKIEQFHFVEKDNENTFKLVLNSQLGTHVEAGYFASNKLPKIGEVPVSRFIGKAAVVDIPCRTITPSDLIHKEDLIRKCDFILLRSGYMSKIRQITRTEIESKERPYISIETAQWLVRKGVSFIGIDSFGFDPCPTYSVHKYLLQSDVLIAEGLVNLRQIENDAVLLIALPLKVSGTEAAPARVVAIEGIISY